MSLMSIRRRRATQKGFNLIEAAIVLGIVGLVVGGIWVAATSVYSNLRSKSASDLLLKVAQSVRALYATSATTGYAANTDITAFMAQSNVLPTGALTTASTAATAANTVNPWNGQIGIDARANGTSFAVTFSNVPSPACVDLVMRNVAGTGRDAGLIQFGGGAAANLAAGTASYPTTATQNVTIGTVVTLTQAQTVCDSGASNTRNVGFLFNLRA